VIYIFIYFFKILNLFIIIIISNINPKNNYYNIQINFKTVFNN